MWEIFQLQQVIRYVCVYCNWKIPSLIFPSYFPRDAWNEYIYRFFVKPLLCIKFPLSISNCTFNKRVKSNSFWNKRNTHFGGCITYGGGGGGEISIKPHTHDISLIYFNCRWQYANAEFQKLFRSEICVCVRVCVTPLFPYVGNYNVRQWSSPTWANPCAGTSGSTKWDWGGGVSVEVMWSFFLGGGAEMKKKYDACRVVNNETMVILLPTQKKVTFLLLLFFFGGGGNWTTKAKWGGGGQCPWHCHWLAKTIRFISS